MLAVTSVLSLKIQYEDANERESYRWHRYRNRYWPKRRRRRPNRRRWWWRRWRRWRRRLLKTKRDKIMLRKSTHEMRIIFCSLKLKTEVKENIETRLNKYSTYWPNRRWWWWWRWLILKDYKQNNGKKEHA